MPLAESKLTIGIYWTYLVQLTKETGFEPEVKGSIVGAKFDGSAYNSKWLIQNALSVQPVQEHKTARAHINFDYIIKSEVVNH